MDLPEKHLKCTCMIILNREKQIESLDKTMWEFIIFSLNKRSFLKNCFSHFSHSKMSGRIPLSRWQWHANRWTVRLHEACRFWPERFDVGIKTRRVQHHSEARKVPLKSSSQSCLTKRLLSSAAREKRHNMSSVMKLIELSSTSNLHLAPWNARMRAIVHRQLFPPDFLNFVFKLLNILCQHSTRLLMLAACRWTIPVYKCASFRGWEHMSSSRGEVSFRESHRNKPWQASADRCHTGNAMLTESAPMRYFI